MKIRGFTLLELMVALAVLSLLLALGAPAFGSLLDDQRMNSSAASLLHSVHYARTEAVRRNRHITLTPVDGDWNNGWLIFIDRNHDGLYDPGEVLLQAEYPARSQRLHANANVATYLRYNAQGESELLNGGFQSGTFSFCPRQAGREGRRLIINRVGRARVERAPIADSICPG